MTLWLPVSDTPAAAAAPSPAAVLPVDWLALGLAAWLVGACVFLVFRFRAYFEMRRELLADAREVGRAAGGLLGPIRLVETPATNTPLAFGVLDRVIALPPRFLALAERPMRDLALAHEFSHHRGGDLLANFAVQPLFALHWFNPLGWACWRAMRRDQEAACDARVVRSADAGLRATYAQTIASFAAGPALSREVALAAPMACPVLGDKSIIHRLRSLTMSDISARRRWAGRGLVLAGALALPLTASISYAEDTPEAPEAPEAPLPPTAPDAPEWTEGEEFDLLFSETEREDDGRVTEKRIVRKRVKGDEGADGERVIIIKIKDKDGKVKVEERRFKGFAFTDEDGNTITDEEFEKRIEEMMRRKEKELEAMGERIEKEMKIRFGEGAEARMMQLGCDGEQGARSAIATADGAFAMAVCADGFARQAKAVAVTSLNAARVAVEVDRNLSEAQCKEALKAIDAEIARLTVES